MGTILREAIMLMNSSQTSSASQQRLNQPMREFLSLLGDSSTDETLLNRHQQPSIVNAFSTFFHSLSLGDMIDISRGLNRHRIFERARQPVRDHLRALCPNERVDIDFLCDRYWNDMFEDPSGFNVDFSQFELNNEQIDFKKSVEKLMRNQIRLDLELIFNTSYDNVNIEQATETWSSLIYDRFKVEIDRFVNLCRACIKNADTQILNLASSRIQASLTPGSITNQAGMSGPFQGFVRSHMQSVLNDIPLNRAPIEEFIVFKQQPRSNAVVSAEPPKSNLTTTTTIASQKTEEMDTNDDDCLSIDSNQFDSASSTLSGNSMDIEQHFIEARNKKQGKCLGKF